MSDVCGLCCEISGFSSGEIDSRYSAVVKSRENILFESDSFLLVPSVGPLNDSHAMLITKRHLTNFSQLPKAELDKSITILRSLNNYYFQVFKKNLIFFESGSGSLTNHSGGCIVHAHIHCLVAVEGFKERLFDEIPMAEFFYEENTLDKQFGYIWFKDGDGATYYCNRPLLPSQFLRYVYAQVSNSGAVWNWRKENSIPGVLKVIENYQKFRDFYAKRSDGRCHIQ
jgi:ATP adenylyltransferase